MSLRETGWVLFLAGLPFAHLLFYLGHPPLDPWHGQAAWAQAWGVILFVMAVGAGGRSLPSNRALACFLGWVGLVGLFSWVRTILLVKTYPLSMLQGLMHLALLTFLYVAAMTTWTTAWIERLLTALAWSGVLLLCYCGLQLLNLDQFFRNLDLSYPTDDQLVGTIGNPAHLAVQLSFLLSLFLMRPGWFWKGMVVVTVSFIGLTSALGGQLAALVVLGWWAWHWKPRLGYAMGLVGIAGLIYLSFHLSLLNDHGRFAAWQQLWAIFQHQPITGLGAGWMMEFSRTIPVQGHPLSMWRHAHNEFLQAALEYGVIGLGCLLWMVRDTFRQLWELPKTPLVKCLGGLFLALLVNSLTLFPLHLWVLGSYGFVAYCGLRVVAQEIAEWP